MIEERGQGPMHWARIRWPDDALLPAPGTRVTIGLEEDDAALAGTWVVVSAHPTSDPGWIEVEVRSPD